jgi:hypothetical protein
MNRSPTRDFVVGLFVLAGLAAVAYLSLSVGGFTFGSSRGLVLYASFDQIGGLKPRAPVQVSGVKVGQVTAIELNGDYSSSPSTLPHRSSHPGFSATSTFLWNSAVKRNCWRRARRSRSPNRRSSSSASSGSSFTTPMWRRPTESSAR